MQIFTNALSKCQDLWNNELACTQMVLDSSARAHIINQYWYFYARQMFEGDICVAFSKDQYQRYLIIDEKVILRFKLLDTQLLPRNYPTEHALDWQYQEPLEGILPCARLHYGYRMDITGTNIKDAFIILPQGKINEWVWQTSGEPIDTFGFQIPFHEPGTPEPQVYWYDNYPLGG
jgi:hypothetical protein